MPMRGGFDSDEKPPPSAPSQNHHVEEVPRRFKVSNFAHRFLPQ
jgi:hypothetical protein